MSWLWVCTQYSVSRLKRTMSPTRMFIGGMFVREYPPTDRLPPPHPPTTAIQPLTPPSPLLLMCGLAVVAYVLIFFLLWLLFDRRGDFRVIAVVAAVGDLFFAPFVLAMVGMYISTTRALAGGCVPPASWPTAALSSSS